MHGSQAKVLPHRPEYVSVYNSSVYPPIEDEVPLSGKHKFGVLASGSAFLTLHVYHHDSLTIDNQTR